MRKLISKLVYQKFLKTRYKNQKTIPNLLQKIFVNSKFADRALDIEAVGIIFEQGPQKGELFELNVLFQTENTISIIVPKRDKEILDYLQPETKLNEIYFHTPIGIFKGRGEVSAKSQIESGPKEGDFSFDIAITQL